MPTHTETIAIKQASISKTCEFPLLDSLFSTLSPSHPQLHAHTGFSSSEILVQSYLKVRLNSSSNPTQPASPSFPGTQHFNTDQEAGCVCVYIYMCMYIYECEPHPAAVHLELLSFQHGSEPTHLFTPEACASGPPPPRLPLFHPSAHETDTSWESTGVEQKKKEKEREKRKHKVWGLSTSHQSNVSYVTELLQLNIIWSCSSLLLLTKLCNVAQPVKPTPSAKCWQDEFKVNSWFVFLCGEGFRIEKTISFLSITHAMKATGAVWDSAAVCVCVFLSHQWSVFMSVYYCLFLSRHLCRRTGSPRRSCVGFGWERLS